MKVLRSPALRLVTALCAGALVLTACGGSASGQDVSDRVERDIKSRQAQDATGSGDTPASNAPVAGGDGGAGSASDMAKTTTSAPPPAAAAPAAPAPAPPQATPAPQSAADRAVAAVSGKGQYLYEMDQTGTPQQVVQRAQGYGLHHLIIRSGNPVDGFYTRPVLDQLLPLAHKAGIKIVAYDGPAMEDIPGDVNRAIQIINFKSSSGDQIDAFAADIESSRAPHLDGPHAAAYTTALRKAAGPGYPMVAVVMNPNYHLGDYPFKELAAGFDVMSPMDYWTGKTRDGAGFVSKSIQLLKQFGRPVSVIGQAYPIESAGTYPTGPELQAAMQAAKDGGATGMSFWAWQFTRPESWDVIQNFRW